MKIPGKIEDNILTVFCSPGVKELKDKVNEIIAYLEQNPPKNGDKFYQCKNCKHVTMYRAEIHDCCESPKYEEYKN